MNDELKKEEKNMNTELSLEELELVSGGTGDNINRDLVFKICDVSDPTFFEKLQNNQTK